MNHPPIGLLVQLPDQTHAQVPLEGVAVKAQLAGTAAEVAVTQRYTNRESRPIEAVYVFPLPSDAAVCGFAAEVDGRRIEGRVEEREKAFEIYDDAMADGHGAFLLDQERPNIFTASLGNIRPGASVAVEIRYVVACTLEGDAVRFQLPTTVSPRYAPAATSPELGQPDHERIDPERRLHVPYGLTLTVEVDSPRPLRRVESPSHPIRTTVGATSTTIELGQDVVALDRDFVLLVAPQDAHAPAARVSRDASGTRFVQVQFVPTFAASATSGNEVVFVVDCSGSMQGDSIAQAKRALELCLRALGEHDTCDIVRFGSSFDALFGTAHALDQAHLQKAVAYVAQTDANLGGTEILAPLQAILARPIDPARPRQILLLTDGQVSNEPQVIELARANAGKARIFTFGIGAGVSEHLVKELARHTSGQVEMIYPGERIEPKVLRQFGRLRTPVLGNIALDWGGLEVDQAPRGVPPIFQGELLTVYARVRHMPAGTAARTVTLRGGAHAWDVPLDLEAAPLGGPVPRFWAREAIRDLEADEGRHGSSQQRPERDAAKKRKLIDIGREHGIVSSLTSYVAVEVRSEADKTTAPSELRKVPVALTAGWGGHGSVTGGLGGAGPMLQASMPAGMPMPSAPPAGYAMPVSAPKSGAIPGMLSRAASAIGSVFRRESATPPASVAPPRPASPAPMKRKAAARARDVSSFDMLEADEMLSPEPEAKAEARKGDGGGGADDMLYDVLLTQAADGSFPLSAALLSWLGGDEAAVRKAAATHGEAVVATALVLRLLEKKAADRRAEWAAADAKARAFLARAGAAAGAFDPAAFVA